MEKSKCYLVLLSWLALGVEGQGILCIMTHCLLEFTSCSLDSQCMEILNCMSACDPTDAECGFTCGMGSEAGKNPHFVSLLACMVENGCIERYEESGACLAEDGLALDTTDYSLVSGDWWTVYGQSCGQTDSHGEWAGAYDWYPCSHARFRLTDNGWINNTTYCPGSDSVCHGDLLVTVPQVYWSSPGVLRHDYPQSEAPVIPQIEDWKWMWVSEDNNWSVVIWCGSNPMLDYNGAFVLSRERSDGSLPPELEPVIREELGKYGLNLDEMCLTNSLACRE